MTIWIDAQLSPRIAKWIADRFGMEAVAVRDLGLCDAQDMEIFRAAHDADAVVLTKDTDFPHLLSQHGPPPDLAHLR